MSATRENGALAMLASLVLEDGRRWGEAAAAWQWEDAAAILDPDSPTPYHFLTRPRGGSKTSDLAGVVVGVMLAQAPRGARLYALAADRDQGRLLIDSIVGYTQRTTVLHDVFAVSNFRVTVPDTSVTLEVMAADAAGSWGLRPYFLVVDEIAQWPETRTSRELFEAVRTATAKRRARMAILTTAGDPIHFAYKLREHARVDPLWRLHEVPGPVPWADPRLLDEQRRALPDSVYQRLHLNQWVEPEDRLTTLAALRECIAHPTALPPRSGETYAIGVDLGIVNDATAAAVCHLKPAGVDASDDDWRVVVDRVETWHGSPDQPVQLVEVRDWLRHTAREYHDARIVIDRHQAVDLAQTLRRQGARVVDRAFTQAVNGELAATLLRLFRTRRIALPDDLGLIAELARVRVRETSPNVLRLDHGAGEHDDRAIAIALAAVHLLERPPSAGPRIRVLEAHHVRSGVYSSY